MISSSAAAAADFPIVTWREGYEIDEVRAALVSVSETLRAYEAGHQLRDAVAADELKQALFQPTKFRQGFEKISVDRFFRELRESLVAYERGTIL
jgi:hypothetical protein